MLTCRIERHENAFLLRANEQLLPLYAYMTYQCANGRFDDFRASGVKLASVAVYVGDRGINPSSAIRPFRPGFMTAPGKYDFRWADEDFRRAVGDCAPGEAFILPRLMLEMPLWWEEAHPDARCLSFSGVPFHSSFSSEEWLQAAVDAMEHFEAWLNESGWNEYVIGWHIAAGMTEEYIRPIIHPTEYLDYSQASQRGYRLYLAERYKRIAALNAAWHAEYSCFEEIPLPTPARRHYALNGSLRDPVIERDVMDFYSFYSDELARAVIKLCHEGKRITQHTKLMGAFYGNISICNTELAHNSLNLLLESNDIDFLASPFCYTNSRAADTDWPFQATLESATLHGKPWFVEADVRTFLSKPLSISMPQSDPVVNRAYDGAVWYGPDTPEGSLGDMLRAFSRILTHSGALWWFDMWGGWYDHDALMAFQHWAQAFHEETSRLGGLTPRAQLAVFLDEETLNYLSPQGSLARSLCEGQLAELGFLGAPYDSYLMSDFEAVDPGRYRAALLLSPCALTPGQKNALSRWKCGGRTLLFTGYPGYFKGTLGEGTDISCTYSGKTAVLQGHMLRNDGMKCTDSTYPTEECVCPQIELVPGTSDSTLACDDEERPVAVLHRSADYQTFWSVPTCLPACMVREILLLSGAHIYTHSRDNVYAGGHFVSIHACTDGIKRLFLPGTGSAFDAFSKEKLPGTENFVELEMKKGETRLLRLELSFDAIV